MTQLLRVALALVLLVASSALVAQQKVYKWVDEDGVLHLSAKPPPESVQAEMLVLPASPPPPAPVVPAEADPSQASTPPADAGGRSAALPAEPTAAPAPVDISAMSLPELDARCDAVREARIAPLKEAEIAKCKSDSRNDPRWCERFNATFGDAVRRVDGTMGPRMFDDLPECVEALQERNRRGI